MFNRITLSFKDETLEANYQNYQNTKNRRPLFTQVILFLFILMSIRLIQLVIQNTSLITLSWLVVLLFGLIALGIVIYKKPKLVRYALIIVNHLIILSSLEQDNTCSPNYYYLRGASMMCVHLVIIIQGEFIDSVFSIISIMAIRLALVFFQDKIFPYPSVLAALVLTGFLICTIHKSNLGFRSQFQLGCVENQWDNILTSLITDPYLLIEFNESQLKFQYKKSHQFQYHCDSDENVRQFLRQTQLENSHYNLEQYFFKNIKQGLFQDQEKLLKQQINVKIKNRLLMIQYSVFFGRSSTILLQIFPSQVEQLIEEKQKAKVEDSYQFKYQKLLKLVFCKLRKAISDRNSIAILSLQKLVVYYSLIEKLESPINQIVSNFNFCTLLEEIRYLYQNKNITKKNNIQTDILGNKMIITLILIQILETQVSNAFTITSKFSKDYSAYEILIEGNFCQKLLSLFESKIKQHSNYLQDIIFDEQCKFKINLVVKLIFSNSRFDVELQNRQATKF